MKRCAIGLMLVLLCSLGLSTIVETGDDVLVVVKVIEPKTINRLRSLPLSIHYRGEGYFMAGIGMNDIEHLEDIDVDFEVVDTEAWTEPYYVINRPRANEIGIVPEIGMLVFQND